MRNIFAAQEDLTTSRPRPPPLPIALVTTPSDASSPSVALSSPKKSIFRRTTDERREK